jgi:ribosomal protein S9
MLRIVYLRQTRSGTRFFSSGNWWDEKPGTGNAGKIKEENQKPANSIFDDMKAPEAGAAREEVKPIKRRSSLFTAAPQRREPVVKGTPKLSMSQALFLAKEAGVFTTREVQTHIIKSPPFTKDESPFLLEDFFYSPDGDGVASSSAKVVAGPADTTETLATSVDESGGSSPCTPMVPETIHEKLIEAFQPGQQTFFARGREWKTRSEGKGTRKRSVAHVLIEKGSGIVKVNGEEDFYKRWPLYYNRFDVLFPFEATRSAGLFDVYISVEGGGISGQAGAARLAIGRALVDACPECEDDFRDSLVLFEDTRQKTSKFPGKRGAYARGNWTLR